jgi:hypothetical protein
MARRTVIIQTVPEDAGATPRRLGTLVDPGNGKPPFGTTPGIDRMLVGGVGDRAKNFEIYYQGWTNSKIQSKAAR